MKVKELKAELAKLPDDAEVIVNMFSGCCGDFEPLEVSDVGSYEPRKDYDGALSVWVNPPPGYRSCRQAAQTKKDHEDYWKAIDENNKKR